MLILAMMLFPLIATAHHGFDCNSRLQFRTDSTLLIMRMSPNVMKVLMNAGDWEKDKNLLDERAKKFFIIQSQEKNVEPVSITAVKEINEEITIIFRYPVMTHTALHIEVVHWKNFSDAFTGTFTVYDLPTSPIEREGKELKKIELSRQNRVLDL